MEKTMKKIISSIFIFFLISFIFAQSNSEQFWNLWNDHKESQSEEFLKNWKKSSKKIRNYMYATLICIFQKHQKNKCM